MYKKLIQFVSALGLLFLGLVLLGSDFVPFFKWWEAIFILGILFLPITANLFECFQDKGYLFSKVIGIGITGYIMWLFSSIKLLRFSSISSILIVILGLIMNGLVLYVQSRGNQQGQRGRRLYPKWLNGDVISSMISQELLFFALFLLLVYIKGFKPEAYGTEKFMDYGFMTSLMRSDYMPPQDFWFSGTKLNYYYVGQFMATMLTKLSFVPVSYGYNLMLMMLGAFAFVLPYSLCFNLIIFKGKEQKDKIFIMPPVISGLIAGAAVLMAGNMHYPVFKWLYPFLHKMLKVEGDLPNYWFPDATRYIGYNPETTDKTIHEFPSYSFVLGDLHAHVINIMFVLTVLGILFAWQLKHRRDATDKMPVWKEILNPTMVILSLFIGLFRTTNYWDFPIYFVVSGAVILFSNMVVYNFKGKSFWLTGLQGLFIFGVAQLVSLPFTLSFDKISNSIRLAQDHSPLFQLMILWGLPIGMVVAFFCFLCMNMCRRSVSKNKDRHQGTARKFILFRFMEFLQDSDLFVLTIGLCAIGLILLPELVYVKDIYSGDYKRANTMFKLTYQAFIMFGVCFGYLFVRFIKFGETILQRIVTIVGLVLFVCTLFYAQNAVKAWFGNIFDHKGYEGLNSAVFMETQMPEDSLAIQWLNENVDGMPVILEANGDSYSDYQRVSVMTGLPTVLGWHTHEWLWKSDVSLLDAREADINTIYTSNDKEQINHLIEKYKIQYIYVGKLEAEKFEQINHNMLRGLGDMVYYDAQSQDKGFETYIIFVGEDFN